jgi:predicted transposase YbfD/YdcC
MVDGIAESFSALSDPHRPGRVQHKLLDVLVIEVIAVIAGADTWTDIANYGVMKKDWLATFLDLGDGVPSHDTLRRVFTLINPSNFEPCFYQWVTAMRRLWIGKSSRSMGKPRRSFNKDSQQGSLHIVSAFATEQDLSLGQWAADGKSNEITAIPELLDSLSLAGHIVTLDAMGCQRAIAQMILEQKADSILALKGNQGNRHKAVMNYCAAACLSVSAPLKLFYDAIDETHGCLVRRRAWVCLKASRLGALRDWPGVRNILARETIRSVAHSHEVQADIRYYLTRCDDAPEVLIQAVHHWAIENSLHWVLDVTFREDDTRSRDKIATRSFALLHKMALNIVRKDKSNKFSLRGRRQNAGWNNDYMAHLLFGCTKNQCQ